MKKMNKLYEAPVAEMIEMQLPVVLLESANVSASNVVDDDDDLTGGD